MNSVVSTIFGSLVQIVIQPVFAITALETEETPHGVMQTSPTLPALCVLKH